MDEYAGCYSQPVRLVGARNARLNPPPPTAAARPRLLNPLPAPLQMLARTGNANYNAISYNATTGGVYARPPLYGYTMLQQALSGGADIIGRQVTSGIDDITW